MSDRTLASYIDSVASATPAPGAGSVAAIAGAMGCALGEMVCRITAGGSETGPSHPLEASLRVLAACREQLLLLSPADEEAYLAFRTAQAMPKSTVSEKGERTAAMQQSLLVAAEVPLQIASESARALGALESVAKLGSRYTLADIATAAHLLTAAINGALANVEVNVRMIRDADRKSQLSLSIAALREKRSKLLASVLAVIEDRSLA
ncbi:MAG: cyclodeaminase/cyclohydrolase family protein [Thermomicrobiales bacterium]